jgi:SPP1 family predicted phage head-tail adaptor
MMAGSLNRRVTLQSKTVSQDATTGIVTEGWADVATVYAKIQPLGGRELELAKAIASEVTYQIDVRYRPTLTAAMRLVYEGRYFNIHAVIDVDMKHEVLQIMCSEGLNNG